MSSSCTHVMLFMFVCMWLAEFHDQGYTALTMTNMIWIHAFEKCVKCRLSLFSSTANAIPSIARVGAKNNQRKRAAMRFFHIKQIDGKMNEAKCETRNRKTDD